MDETTPKSKKRSAEELAKFESKHGITLCARYKRFWQEEVDDHVGKKAGGLPSYGRDVYLRVKFKRPSFELFDENDIDRDENPGMIVLAALGEEPQFLACNVAEEACPVSMWEHEDGMFHPVWPSFDEFLSALVTKGAVSPIKKLEKARAKAEALHDEDKEEEALAVLLPALEPFPPGGDQMLDGYQDEVPEGYGLLGRIYNAMHRYDEAIKAYEQAISSGSDYAALNLMSLYDEDQPSPIDVVRVGIKLKEGYLQDYPWFWVRRYLGRAYLRLGDFARAYAEFHEIHDRYFKDDPDKISEVQKELHELADTEPKLNAPVRAILEWMKPKSYERTAAEYAANRAWWDSLPAAADYLQAVLEKEAKIKEDEPISDLALARILDLEAVDLDNEEKPLNDVRVLSRLTELRRLDFYGEPDSLEPLRALTHLERLELNGNIVKKLKLPSKANKSLFAAAEAGDRVAIDAALVAGADILAKDDDAKNVLLLVRLSDAIEDDEAKQPLLLYLIERGADLYAESIHGGDVRDYLGDEDAKKALEDAYQKRGGKPPESAFRVLEAKREPHQAGFASLDGTPDDFSIDADTPIGDDFPKGAFYPMRKDYGGYKKDTKLSDFHETRDWPIVSERLRDVLLQNGCKDVQFLPVTLKDHDEQTLPDRYYLMHPPIFQCLDEDASEPQYNHIDPESFNDCKRMVIDPAHVPEASMMFRIKGLNDKSIIVKKALADAVQKAELTGIGFALPRR